MARSYNHSVYVATPLKKQNKAPNKTDLARAKLIFGFIPVAAFLAGLGFFYIWSRVQILNYGFEINELRKQNIVLKEEYKQITVELEALKSPERIEKIAREKLKMGQPKGWQIITLP